MSLISASNHSTNTVLPQLNRLNAPLVSPTVVVTPASSPVQDDSGVGLPNNATSPNTAPKEVSNILGTTIMPHHDHWMRSGWSPALLRAKGYGRWAQTNLYWERADEIGAIHGIPNHDRLASYLQPTEWQIYGPPLTEERAIESHKAAVDIATMKLHRACDRINQIPDRTLRETQLRSITETRSSMNQMYTIIRQIWVDLARDFANYLADQPSRAQLSYRPRSSAYGMSLAAAQGPDQNSKRVQDSTIKTTIHDSRTSERVPQSNGQHLGQCESCESRILILSY